MMRLDEVPDDVMVVWFGHKWDDGCTEDIRINPPESEFCHGCFSSLGVRSSGVAERTAGDEPWLFYDAGCWAELLNERYAKAQLTDEDPDYERKPHPNDW